MFTLSLDLSQNETPNLSRMSRRRFAAKRFSIFLNARLDEKFGGFVEFYRFLTLSCDSPSTRLPRFKVTFFVAAFCTNALYCELTSAQPVNLRGLGELCFLEVLL